MPAAVQPVVMWDTRTGLLGGERKKMNGPIVLNIALCLYGNAFQQNEIIPDFFNNLTAQFCKKIEFSLIRRSLLEKTEKKILYENPNNFFDKLGA